MSTPIYAWPPDYCRLCVELFSWIATGTFRTSGGGVVELTAGSDNAGAIIDVSGTYAGLSFVIEGSADGTTYIPLSSIDTATGASMNGTIAPADNSTLVLKVACAGFSKV